MEGLQKLLLKLGSIGDRETDDDGEKLRHRLLVYMGILMSGGGILWGSISAYFDLLFAAIVPYGYVVLTVLNLSYFHVTKNFSVTRAFQVFISLLLPFLFQWVLGGFLDSGGVMLWAMLALVGSLTFGSSRQTLMWLVVYVVMTIISGVIDPVVMAEFGTNPSHSVQVTFFVINIVVISPIVFGLTIYLLSERERANAELETANDLISRLNEGLEDEVAARTEEVAQSLSRFRAILNNMADGLVAVGVDGDIQAHNPAISELFDLGEESLVQKRARDILPRGLYELAENSMSMQKVMSTDLDLGGNRTGACVASPIQTAGEAMVGAVLIVRDVTLEREIDRMKTDFTATVSHELRTPLTSVLGFAKLTKNRLEEHVLGHVPTDDKKVARAVKQVRGNLDIILSEGERLTSLISDVLDISKLEAGKMEWKKEKIDSRALVERAVQSTASLFVDSSVQLTTNLPDDLPPLYGDEDRLLQVLINLISNAEKFTDEGSVVVSAQADAHGVEFTIKDTGIGIEPANRATVFEKFRQVGDTLTDRPTGTGLGLPISKQIVTAHGGRIWVDSVLGEGSVFHFTVPEDDPGSAVSEAWIQSDPELLVGRPGE